MSENVIPIRGTRGGFTGPLPGKCDICGRKIGNLPKHRPSCARNHGRLPMATPISRKEEELVARAGIHAMPWRELEPEERFWRGVTDLDVARLVHEIERGNIIYPSPTWRTWYSTTKLPYMRRSLTTVVAEALRVGIVRSVTVPSGVRVFQTRLVAEKTHARLVGCVNKPACAEYAEPPRRWRLLNREQLAYVDCQACMDQPLSAVQY